MKSPSKSAWAAWARSIARRTPTSERQVAIKVLPEAFAQRCRAARPISSAKPKTLASLNHPNIAQIYGLEKSSGMQALVMELVEGDDSRRPHRARADSAR